MNLTRRTLFKCFGFGAMVTPILGVTTLSIETYNKSIQSNIKQTVFTSPDDCEKVREVRLDGIIREQVVYADIDKGYIVYHPEPLRLDSTRQAFVTARAEGKVEVDLEPSYVHDYRYRHKV